MITYDGVEVRYGDFTAIPKLDLTINRGEFFTMLGPSGCGKTTALRTLAGLETPSAGDIIIDGRPVTNLPPDRREVGMVFQNYALFPSMSVADNIEFGLRVRKTPRAERERLVREMAEVVELSSVHMDKNLDELSGGQQQRVAIARALVLQPKILLLDEPLSNLDAKLRQQMRLQLKRLQQDVGITTVYVTHDQDEALAMSDRIAVFNKGRVEQVGTPQEIYDHAATEFVCTFVGESSPLTPELVKTLARGGDQGDGVSRATGARLDVEAASYLREERAKLEGAPGRAGVTATVVARLYHGTHSTYALETHGTLLQSIVIESGAPRPDAGDQVTVWIDPADVLQYSGSVAA
ncbi:ABC transporter ATP-binding protein [Luteococcus peritonei]|uniref:ABC transporter ATP-binding protein n=1 Tax=Luteococcus peritonei TaxID=88874 RepID=A0ABW4RUJ9_9ACTN